MFYKTIPVMSMAAGRNGVIYIVGTGDIYKYDPDGKYTNRFGSEGDKPGQLRSPNGLSIDGRGRVYISDIKGVQIFTPDGVYLDMIDIDGVAFDLWFDDSGQLFVASNADKVLEYEIVK